MTTLAIIGTAGRRDDGKMLAANPERYHSRMFEAVTKLIDSVKPDALISGAAAYADHYAIFAFLRNPNALKLILELPAQLEADDGDGLRFHDSGSKSPGSVANYYHRLFTKNLKPLKGATWSSFLDLKTATSHPNCTVNVTYGFKERNLKVAAKATHCLAMTFGEGKVLKDGGTAHTMGAFLAKGMGESYHLDLNTLKGYKGAIIST